MQRALAMLMILLTAGLAPVAGQVQAPATAAQLLRAATSWGYQLQEIDPEAIARVPYDMLVLDYSRDGSDAQALTADEVAKLKVKPDGTRRVVLAYLSIGEAETYRYYWKRYWGWLFGAFGP